MRACSLRFLGWHGTTVMSSSSLAIETSCTIFSSESFRQEAVATVNVIRSARSAARVCPQRAGEPRLPPDGQVLESGRLMAPVAQSMKLCIIHT